MVHKRFLNIPVILIAFAGICSFIVNDDLPTRIKQQLDKWVYEQPVEKAYLQLDKPYYAAGDDIWFKAYVVSGNEHRLSNVSGIVNIELIDWRDSVKQSVKLQLNAGIAWGDFALADTLQQGNYRIRAYTNYMRNAGSEYFFDQAVSIINTIMPVSKSIAAKQNDGKTDVQFFPESGYLVNGIPTKVAFKAVAPGGLGTAIKGTISDSKGKEVAVFSSSHLGMGVFELTPVIGETYKAAITSDDGIPVTVSLPAVISKGYVLSITDQNEQNLQLKVAASPGINQNLVLVAQNSGKIYYNITIKPGIITIPKSKFPTGIIQFTLFSTAGEALNERLIFIRSADQLNLTVTADQQKLSPRQKVQLSFNALTSDDKPAAGYFSVSVTNESKVPVNEATENNIMASLLLTSDLHGYVEQPAYYFLNNSNKTKEDLDVLMLTQGYRRFEWKRVMERNLPAVAFKPESTLQVSGTILTSGGKPEINAKVKLIDLDSAKFERDTITDERGRFVFKNLTFEDSIRFIVQARTAKNKRNVVIKMDKAEPASTSAYKNKADFETDNKDALNTYAQSSKQFYAEQRKYGLGNHVISLREVVIREKKQALKYSANLNGPGNADQIIQGKELRDLNCVYITNCLQGRLLGVIFRNGIPYSTRGFKPMQLIVDGAYVESSYLNEINYMDVQSIEVLRNGGLTSIYGGRGGNGVMLVTTRRGDDIEYIEPVFGRGITTYYPKGYYTVREFYSPQYNRPKTNKQVADLRTTVYWKPDVLTGNDGKAVLAYFNAGKGTYRVVIEGIDNSGNLGRQVYRYTVE